MVLIIEKYGMNATKPTKMYGGMMNNATIDELIYDDEECNIDIINDKGTQGIIIHSEGLAENKLVKIFRKEDEPEKKWCIRDEIYQKLRDADPEESRFLMSKIIKYSGSVPCTRELDLGSVQPFATIFNYMDELNDPKSLSKESYRYLRRSIEILAEIGIVHGDLPGNVMINPLTELPIIIDFDNSFISSEDKIKSESFDMRAFLNHFKSKRR